MAQNVSYKYLLASVVDPGNQSTFVVTDVENNACPNTIGIPPALFQISEVRPAGTLGHFVPDR
jgi:hypothetical protein